MKQATRTQRLAALALLAGAVGVASAQTRAPRAPSNGGLALPPAATVPAAAATAATLAPTQAAPVSSGAQGDSIVAIVNRDIITRRELDQRLGAARRSLQQQNIPLPDAADLDRQVLERMITETAQLQEADRAGIRVGDEQLDRAIERIAEQNNITVAKMRQDIQAQGIDWSVYRGDLRDQIRLNRLREQEVDATIHISEAEIDAFLAEQATQASSGAQPAAASGAQLALAQILVRVPEGSSPDEIAQLRARAQQLLQRARDGADFAQLAAASSDGEEALRGGDLGARPTARWPDLFLQAVAQLQPGQISEPVQSGNGFHVIKLVAREGGTAGAGNPLTSTEPMDVTQTRARHILIRTSQVVNDDQARQQLQALRSRIQQGGANFADMARQYSNDTSAPQGGELGWLSPGETVPAFEQAMDSLQPGTISEPVQSPFGWHLILVEERRTQDMSGQAKRMQARQVLFQRKLEPAWEEWTQMTRSRAYVENRLVPRTAAQ